MTNIDSFVFAKRIPEQTPIGSTTSTTPDHVHLSFGFAASDLFPINELGNSAREAIIENGRRALQYSGSNAQDKIKKWIQARSSVHRIQVDPGNLLITYGAAHGITLTLNAFIDPGDHIWVEAPTFFGALQSFQLVEAEVTSFPMDEHGVRVDLIEEALIEAKSNNQPLPKLFYTIPTFQNPGGITLSLERREQLARLAREYNFFILEDDAYMELNFTGQSLPTLYSLSPERVVYLNTFSKTIGPGIRLGWVIADRNIIEKLTIFLGGSPVAPMAQEIIARLLENFSFEDHVDRLRLHYRKQRDIAAEAVRKYFGSHVSFVLPQGGFFIWLTFRDEVNTSSFLSDASRRGVSYVDGRNFYVGAKRSNDARICFSYCSEEELDRGIKRIADAYFGSLRHERT
ncbi:PLP-dependent aminotransferase family protein [Paenibacillus periandrae]|uniref:aminotransferase-like domain-containing protein n=1 Tax=Paenibacillus periandrae TaxID=1761741 RepID=UPI001F09569D|nr:PLP-dependent aminotransferase family protein [Paenibacillus periandrae]